MPREIKTTVYTFDELSDDAKEKARGWYKDGCMDYDWWDCTYEDAANVGLKIIAFECHRYVEGQFTKSAVDVANSILQNHGVHCETYKTAMSFWTESLSAVNTDEDEQGDKLTDLEAEFLKSLCEDYRILLDCEYKYLLSNKCVDDSILANGYTFTINGKREG